MHQKRVHPPDLQTRMHCRRVIQVPAHHITRIGSFQAKHAKYSNFNIIETTASIPTKFCTTIKTTKYSVGVQRRTATLKTENIHISHNHLTDLNEL